MAEIYPLQVLIASLAGWMNRRQGEVLDYLLLLFDGVQVLHFGANLTDLDIGIAAPAGTVLEIMNVGPCVKSYALCYLGDA